MRTQFDAVGNQSSDDLVTACRVGDARAWEALVHRYERLVYAIAVREGLSPDDAADATQATFEALLDGLPRIASDASVGSWLACVARRHAWRGRDRTRREEAALKRGLHDRADHVGLATLEPNDSIPQERFVELYESLHELGEPCRSILMALYFDASEPSYADIAAKTGRPVGSIGPTRARCLQRLRSMLTLDKAS